MTPGCRGGGDIAVRRVLVNGGSGGGGGGRGILPRGTEADEEAIEVFLGRGGGGGAVGMDKGAIDLEPADVDVVASAGISSSVTSATELHPAEEQIDISLNSVQMSSL